MCHWNEINDKVDKKIQKMIYKRVTEYYIKITFMHKDIKIHKKILTWWCKKTLSNDITHLIFFTFPAVLQHFKKYIYLQIVQKKPHNDNDCMSVYTIHKTQLRSFLMFIKQTEFPFPSTF
jgi:hypothetical protein